jgi:hypothetical protein
MRLQAHVRQERAFGDALNVLAPKRDDILVVGAAYK